VIAADITTRLRARPFAPFRIVTTDGMTYEIRHPDLVMPTQRTLIIGYPTPGEPHVALRYDLVPMLHIIRLEDVPATSAAG
jgi:hypothetical protein